MSGEILDSLEQINENIVTCTNFAGTTAICAVAILIYLFVSRCFK